MAPIEHMDEERQKDLIILKSRALLVKQRTQTVNSIRGHMRSLGLDDSELTIKNMKKKAGLLRQNLLKLWGCRGAGWSR